MNKKEAIVYFKNYIKVKKEVIKERQKEWLNADSRYTQQLEEMVEVFETVLNLLEKKDTLINTMQAEFERLEDLEDNTDMLKLELQKKDKIIDEMTYYLSNFDIDEMCEKCDRCIGNGCYADDDMEFKINCIKKYFERKVENGN